MLIGWALFLVRKRYGNARIINISIDNNAINNEMCCHLYDFNTTFQALYSRVIVNDDVKEKIPRSQTLPQTLRGKNGLSASSLVIVDSRTIMLKDFTFMGLAPGEALGFSV